MSKFNENLYYLSAINYFLKGQNVISLDNYTVLVGQPEETIYDSIWDEYGDKAISFSVGVVDSKEIEVQKSQTKEVDYATVFFKKTNATLRELNQMPVEEMTNFIFKPEKRIRKTPFLSWSYTHIRMAQAAYDGLPVLEDYLSHKAPSQAIQMEVEKYAKLALQELSQSTKSAEGQLKK